MFRLIGQITIWILTWFYYVLIVCYAGAMLGVISHLLVGSLLEHNPDYGYLASFGFSNGLRYGGVWAGGFAIVLCVIRARKEYLQKHSESEESAV